MRARRLIPAFAAVLLVLVAESDTDALTCIAHEDVRAAAREAVAGEHPHWADSYLVGRVEAVERIGLEPIVLTVTPTHVFGGGPHQEELRLAARQDGPPDPASWRAGSLWFLALDADEPIEGTDALIAPCAPNFEVADAHDLASLVAVASEVDVRDASRADSSSAGAPGVAFIVITGVFAVAATSLVAFRRRSS
jgi:hypothetical protein